MPIPVISTEELRRRLAGVADPMRPDGGEGEAADVRDAAVRLGTILARLFGDSLDRVTLWARIASAFETACAKVDDGDLDRFASICLEHVKADPGAAAACEPLGATLEMFGTRPIEWRQAFARYCRTHSYALASRTRKRWELVKKGEADL